MKVRDLMDRSLVACSAETTLDVALFTMRMHDRDALPVTRHDGRVTLGMVSDRDIAMTLASHARAGFELTVGEALRPRHVVIAPDDDIRELLRCMAHHRARRVAVVDANDRLEGTIGVEELVRRVPVSGGHAGGLTAKDLLETLRALATRPHGTTTLEPAGAASPGVHGGSIAASVASHALPVPVTLG